MNTPLLQTKGRRGIIMVFVLLLMPICVMLGAIMLSNIISEKHFLRHEQSKGQSFYLAETGLNSAYYAFSASIFTSFTHEKDNDETDPNVSGTTVTGEPLTIPQGILDRIPFTRVSGGDWDGWYEYTWEPGDNHDSLTNTGQTESIRFRVSRTFDGSVPGSSREVAWEIVCVASLGSTVKTHRLSGQLEGLTTHAIFDAGNLNEFIRGQNQDIFGKVHANGDIYLKPSGTTLSVVTGTTDPSFTTAGNFWYGKDATGRTNMGNVRINDVVTGSPLTSAEGWPNGLDSFSDDWAPQALALWGDMVKDQSLGATVKGVPPTQSFEPDGFYADKASSGGLHIHVQSGQTMVGTDNIGSGPLAASVTPRSFYNHAEKRMVDAVQIDVSQLTASDYPNKLIYSEKPLILINAQELPQDTSIVSQSGIYTAGDFNKELATQDDYDRFHGEGAYAGNPDPTHTTKKSAALMTRDRIWHVSKNFNFPDGNHGFKPTADDPEEYADDNEYVNRDTNNGNKNVIEVNGMLLDGAPLHDETWNREVVTDPDTGEQKAVPKYGPNDPDPNNGSASWDDFLENHGGNRVVKKRGSIVHLQNADMAGVAALSNPGVNIPDGVCAWYHRVAYNPPYRDYGYDELLKTNPPPFAPYVAARSMWKAR